jgi:hypothetical protein
LRYLDIALAILIGTSAISGILVWNPRTGDEAAASSSAKTLLMNALTTFVEEKGMAWFLQSPPEELCAGLASDSNSTFEITGVVGTYRCGPQPPEGATAASLSFDLSAFEVSLEAWRSAAA